MVCNLKTTKSLDCALLIGVCAVIRLNTVLRIKVIKTAPNKAFFPDASNEYPLYMFIFFIYLFIYFFLFCFLL